MNDAPLPPFTIETQDIEFDASAAIGLVIVQPTRTDFSRLDVRARLSLFENVLKWLSTPVRASKRSAVSRVGRPQTPRITCFPELYLPVDGLRAVLETQMESNELLITGLVSDKSNARPFFDAAALRDLLADTAKMHVKNRDFLKRLAQRAADTGKAANLAVTLSNDRYGDVALIFHAKLIPSVYERHHRLPECTLPSESLQLLRIQRPTGPYTVLPLICSDSILRHDQTQQQLLHHLGGAGQTVDLLCILAMQSYKTAMHPPWPREYQLTFLELAEHRYGLAFDRTHTIFANHGSYQLDDGPHGAGYSAFSLQNARTYSTFSLPAWDGKTFVYGRACPKDMPESYYWLEFASAQCFPPLPDATANERPPLTKQIATLFTHSDAVPPRGVSAVLQHFEIQPHGTGGEAFVTSQLLTMHANGTVEVHE